MGFPTILIRDLLSGIPSAHFQHLSEEVLSAPVAGVTSNSVEVVPAGVFVAVRGVTHDGHRYIPEVDRTGVALIVGEAPAPTGIRAAYVQVSDSRLSLARLAANFHGNPSHALKLIGVTGTSGKTTTTYLIESILQSAGEEVGVIGTVNFRHGKRILPSTHTTPGAVELQRLLAQMKQDGCTAVVMEVSSHALRQHRAAYLAFDGVVFTNLSPEHLDFHPDMEDYFRAKAMLFQDSVDESLRAGKSPTAAINSDDDYGKRLLRAVHPQLSVRSYGMNPDAEVSGNKLSVDLNGIHGMVGGVRLESSLTGRFNAMNVLAAISVTQGVGIPEDKVIAGIRSLQSVPGRMQRIPNPLGINVLVDYAHKPDALENVLQTLAEIKGDHQLITVFGCGGDRDRKKRPVMGGLSAKFSDAVWVTSDNPRTENPGQIINEILAGVPSQERIKVTVQPDRRNAIFEAISTARQGDLVLIAGKGHETYQILPDPADPLKTLKIHFDDCEVATQALHTKARPQ